MPVTTGTTAVGDDGVVQAAGYVADEADSGVRQVSYTVGQSGHKYKWLPYQPKSRKMVQPLRAEAAQYTEPAQPGSADATHPLTDPFGDGRQPLEGLKMPSAEEMLAGDDPLARPLGGSPGTTLQQDNTFSETPTPGPSISIDAGGIDTDPLDADSLAPPQGPGASGTDRLGPGVGSEQLRLDNGGRKPSTDDLEVADAGRSSRQECRSPEKILDPIGELDYKTAIREEVSDPTKLPRRCGIEGGDFVPRQWAPTTFMWQASGLCHKPAYFEDVHLERYGHSWGPYVQPLMSGAHFFLNVPILPYKMGLYPPNECVYTLGYYRPGNCAPYMLDPLPLSVRAGLAQAGAAVGMAYILP